LRDLGCESILANAKEPKRRLIKAIKGKDRSSTWLDGKAATYLTGGFAEDAVLYHPSFSSMLMAYRRLNLSAFTSIKKSSTILSQN
jgi:hypothetical protein